ncbi:MAG: SufD family Fe-S cluster assembly protein [Candidatus Gracilibacteria bacterium]|nr:SufD family Fe-S cluster assembly protein [Candidatus Gracilibacteria bacterium]
MKNQIQYLHLFPQTIHIPSNESWIILDSENNNTEQVIILAEGAKLDFYSARTSGKLHLRIIHQGAGSNSQIQCGFHTQENEKIEAIIKSSFEVNDASSEIYILSLAETDGEVLLDSSIEIQEGVKRIVGRLKERHIFLGSGGKIRGIPALIVHSDDIEASHALAIDRISDEELFYLRSRGFNRDEGTGLLLDGAISEIFTGLKKVDEEMYNKCKEKIFVFSQ